MHIDTFTYMKGTDMSRMTLHMPDLMEVATEQHPELSELTAVAIEKVGADVVNDAREFCTEVAGDEFTTLLSSLQLEHRLPDLQSTIDASDSHKRVMDFTIPAGHSREDIRGLVQSAWDASVKTYAEALYLRVRDLADGQIDSTWTPASQVDYPSI